MFKKQIIEVLIMILSSVISVIVSNLFLPLHISIFVGLILMLVINLLSLIVNNNELKNNNDNLEIKISDLANTIKALENTNKALENTNKALENTNKALENTNKDLENTIKKQKNIPIKLSRGNRLFLMAISQDFNNPLFIGLLKKAVFEENNILAGYLLGDIYCSSLEFNGKKVVGRDYDMAAKVYQFIKDNDNYGVSDWMLGWLYQFNLINDAHTNTEDKNMETARNYYESSKEKGYPKALNSLANLMINKCAGFDSIDEINAISLYHDAAKFEDNYALLNCGHYYKSKNNFSDALEFYLKSANFNCPEGCVNVGEIYEKLSQINNSNINNACHYYINCIKFGEFFQSNDPKKKFVAKAYYRIGNIVNNQNVLNKETKSFFENLTKDIGPYCLSNAYNIISEIIDTLPHTGNEEFYEIYEKLRVMYHSPL